MVDGVVAAASLAAGGATDLRLRQASELHSLVDDGKEAASGAGRQRGSAPQLRLPGAPHAPAASLHHQPEFRTSCSCAEPGELLAGLLLAWVQTLRSPARRQSTRNDASPMADQRSINRQQCSTPPGVRLRGGSERSTERRGVPQCSSTLSAPAWRLKEGESYTVGGVAAGSKTRRSSKLRVTSRMPRRRRAQGGTQRQCDCRVALLGWYR